MALRQGVTSFLTCNPAHRTVKRTIENLAANDVELDEEDPDGAYFIHCLLQELVDYPHRWEVAAEHGVRILRRLVRLDDPVEYENWLDAEDIQQWSV